MLAHYLHLILNYISQHPLFGELFAFTVSFLESLPLIGTIVPGSVTMTAVGVLIGAAILPPFLTIASACAGAFAGDALGFWLGHKYKQQLRTIWPLKKYPKLLDMSENFFKKHGGKSILIGRFVGPIRSTVPMVAGILKMSWSRFVGAAIPSAVLWALLYMIPGVLIGALSMELPPGKTTEFLLYSFISILLAWLIIWTIQHFFKQLANMINNRINQLWTWMSHHSQSNTLIKFITNPNNPEDHNQLTLILISTLLLLCFFILFINVILQSPLLAFNQPLFDFLQSIHATQLTNFFIVFTCLGSPGNIILMTFIICAVLFLQKESRLCLHILSTLVVTCGAIVFFKFIFHSARPMGFLIPITSSSFPSGHTALSLTMIGLIAYITATQLPQKIHRWVYWLASVTIVFVAISRIYLGAHWLTDIIGSSLLGFTILLLSIMLKKRQKQPVTIKKFNLTAWLITIALTFIITTGLQCTLKFNKLQQQFTPVIKQTTISFDKWQQKAIRSLPIYRTSRFGHPNTPLNIQIAAHLAPLKAQLIKKGWQPVVRKKMTTQPPVNLSHNLPHPLFPWLYNNRPPGLYLIKVSEQKNTSIELRLWASNINFSDNPIPLYLGSINFYTPNKHIIHIKKKSISFHHNGGMQQLLNDLENYKIKKIQYLIDDFPKKIKTLGWRGDVILISPQLEHSKNH